MREAPKLPSVNGHVERVCFDLDGTLAETLYPTRRLVGEPISEGVALLNHYAGMGYSIVIHTSRPSVDEPFIWEWVQKWNLPVDKIVCGKPLAALYVDDKGWRFER